MCDYPFFIPQVVLFANSSLFWFKVTNEHREFRNYLCYYNRKSSLAAAFSDIFLIKALFCSFNDLILQSFIQISEMIAVTSYPYDQITVFIRMLLCIDECLPVNVTCSHHLNL